MNDYTLEEVFEIVYKQEFVEFDNPRKHRFSSRHRRAMKNILHPKSQTKSVDCKVDLSHIPLHKRLLVFSVLIFLAVITGAAFIFRIVGFSGTVYPDNIHMFSLNDPNAPKTIEEVYYLEALPGRYEYADGYGEIGDGVIRRVYTDQQNGGHISFEQYAKCVYNVHYDNEHCTFEELEINGYNGFIWRSNQSELKEICWDNGDYILSICGEIDENEAIFLAKSAKIL